MVVLSAIFSFISTNLDDFLVLMLLYTQIVSKKDPYRILFGQYLGIGTLLAVSLICARILGIVPERYLRLLGFVPIFLGLRTALSQSEDSPTEGLKISLCSVALLTISGGGDNLGVYIPMLTGMSIGHIIITILTYALMIPLWNLLARQVAALPPVQTFVLRCKRYLIPVVFVGLGLLILFGLI